MASQSSTQLNHEFRELVYYTSVEKGEYHVYMERFARGAEEKNEYQRILYIEETGKEIKGIEESNRKLVNNLEGHSHTVRSRKPGTLSGKYMKDSFL